MHWSLFHTTALCGRLSAPTQMSRMKPRSNPSASDLGNFLSNRPFRFNKMTVRIPTSHGSLGSLSVRPAVFRIWLGRTFMARQVHASIRHTNVSLGGHLSPRACQQPRCHCVVTRTASQTICYPLISDISQCRTSAANALVRSNRDEDPLSARFATALVWIPPDALSRFWD